MPQFTEHIAQFRHNLGFLEFINSNPNYIDWQVTTCFYAAVHLVNAHLSLFDMQFRKHIDVKHAINPKSEESMANGTSLDQPEYLSYIKLQSLSRRSRYLVNEKDNNLEGDRAFLTYEVHLEKALRHLNCLIRYFVAKHRFNISPIKVKCSGIRQGELSFIS